MADNQNTELRVTSIEPAHHAQSRLGQAPGIDFDDQVRMPLS